MSGQHKRPKLCRRCGKRGTPKRPISFRGLCVPCQITVQTEAIEQMAGVKGGEYRERWERGLKAFAAELDAAS